MTPHSFREALDALTIVAREAGAGIINPACIDSARAEVERLYDEQVAALAFCTEHAENHSKALLKYIAEMNSRLDAAHAARGGEEYTVERTTLSENPMILFRNGQFHPGDRVYVTKGEAG